MPRLTRRVFVDLAIWMVGFGILIGVVFPPFCLLLGLPSGSVLTAPFFAATLAAGVAVGAVNYALARMVVGRRFAALARGMQEVESQLSAAAYSPERTGCDPERCALPVDSDDECGATAAAFNRLVATLARSHAIEAALREFSGVLSREFEVGGLATAALDGVLRQLRAAGGAILLTRSGEMDVVASRGLRGMGSVAASDHVRAALRGGHVERIRVDQADLMIDSLLVAQTPREVVIAPIVFKGVPLGALVLATTGTIRPDDVALLEQFRADLGLAFNNALAHDRLERLAAVDPLTDAYNRRFGMTRLQEEFARAVRTGSPLGVLMLDIDHFKTVNDTWGHVIGDRVLRAVATAARRTLRNGDVLIRYGGEEFLILLPGADVTDITEVGERLRRAVREATVRDGEALIGVTVSLGAACCCTDTPSPEALIARADRALYRAKDGGRNRLDAAFGQRVAINET